MGTAIEDDLKAQGFDVLVRLPDSPLELGRSRLTMRRDFAEKNPNAALAIVASTLEARNMIRTQPDKAVDSLVKWAQLKNRSG